MVLKKAHTHLFCLRKLKSFQRPDLLSLILGGNISKCDKGATDKVIAKAASHSAVVGRTQDGLDTLHDRRVTNKRKDILDDPTHPLRQEFDGRLIQGSGRMRVSTEGQNYKVLGFFCTPGCCPSQQFSIVLWWIMSCFECMCLVMFFFFLLRSRDVISPRGINKGSSYCILYLRIFDGH